MEKKRKFAVITGAGGTLCSCIAKHLAGQGVAVALIGRSYDKLKMVGDEIDKLGGEYVIKCADVTDKERIREIAAELYSELGACDYLINGAGGNQMMAMTTLTEYDPAELSEQRPEGMRGFFDLDMDVYESVLKINTVGTVVCCQVFGEQMAMAGGGAIINFASMNTYCPLTRVPAYAMGKAAIENYTRWLANYLAHEYTCQRHSAGILLKRALGEIPRYGRGRTDTARRAGHRAYADAPLWRGWRSSRLRRFSPFGDGRGIYYGSYHSR